DYIGAIANDFKNNNQVAIHRDLINIEANLTIIQDNHIFAKEDHMNNIQDNFDKEDYKIATQDNLVNNKKNYLAFICNVFTDVNDN
ncbi:6595_t:CDS:1, partial [Cetraspora pellucida]